MEELNIRELREVAEKATPGPWIADCSLYEGMAASVCNDTGADRRTVAELRNYPDAVFIATFNPATVLALLSSAEAREEAEANAERAFKNAAITMEELEAAETRAQQVEARVEELEKALKPFAAAAEVRPLRWDGEKTVEQVPEDRDTYPAGPLAWGHVRAARQALQQGEGQ